MSVYSKDSIFDEKSASLDIFEEDIDNNLEPWENLIQCMTVNHLDELSKIFKNKSFDNGYLETHSSLVQLSKEQFVNAIDTIIGNSKYSLQAISLFNEIPHPDEEKITWKQFLDYYINHAIAKEGSDIKFTEPVIFAVPHVKRETIMKIVLLETDISFCYAIISKFGKVGLYTGDMNLLATYNVIFTRTDKNLNDKYRPRKTVWVTDAIFLPNVRMLVICSSARSLIFYDASGQKHIPLWLIEGIPDAIQSLAYHCDVNSKLFIGDSFGSIITLTFMQQSEGLFRKKYSDKLTTFYWRELSDETAYVTIETYKKMHSNLVRQIIYYPETFTLVSCSRDYKKSVVFFNLKERRYNYIFKLSQGASCFSLNHDLHILLTGCDNGSVQIWNLFVSSKPIATLLGHKTAVVDVKIIAYKNSAMSCSRDGVLIIWDLKSHSSIQTITIYFPSFAVLGKLIEWGTSTLYPGPKRTSGSKVNEKKQDNLELGTRIEPDPWNRSTILITCCNYMAKIKLTIDNITENDCNNAILPPPPLQNDILVPEAWKMGDHEMIKNDGKDLTEFDEEKIHPTVKSIMERDFLNDIRYKHDMNYKVAVLEAKKSEMRKPVSQCAPYLALDLYDIDEIRLTTDLPVPAIKKTHQLAERTLRLLSAASTRSGILSDRSSKSRSSRSSVVEF